MMTADSPTATAKMVVLNAIDRLFGRRDVSAVDRYWSSRYVEHSIVGGEGLDGLRETVAALPDGFRHERLRLLADGDLVVAHGVYHGLGPTPIAAFDLWRVADGQIAEHWDARQPSEMNTVSGHSMVDGPTEVTEPDKTASSRALVQEFVELIMMGGDRSQIGRFFDGNHFIQHNPQIADGVSGLGEAIQTGVWAAVVERAHRILADGEFGFTQGEGTLQNRPTLFYDLFRVQHGKLAEHWDVVFAKPQALRHHNGII
jgi:predicted SnoaL-like aldol condensation-catalyzing enzyme